MTEPRLKSGLWVRAQIRRYDREGRSCTVLRHGDDDAGAIVLKVLQGDGGARIFAQTTAADGALAWHMPLGPDPVPEAEADAYIARAADFDPDGWALEILDRDGSFEADGPVLS